MKSGLAVDGRGALLVDDALVSAGADTIIGAGDATRVGERPLRMSCQAAIPLMREGGGGAIVNLSSVSGIKADAELAAYDQELGI